MNRLLYYLVCLPWLLPAQQQVARFDHIGMEAGLSNLGILSLYRDSRGFLWIGTNGGGLNRYDGHAMEVYRNRENDSLSICNDHINNILEDREGYIWMGTDKGVCRMNPANGRCQQFNQRNGRLRGDYGSLIFQDKKGQIWASNHGGLSRLDTATGRFAGYPAVDSTEVFNYLAFDTLGRLWCGTLNGILLVDPRTDAVLRILRYPDTLPGRGREIGSTGVHIDRSDNIWVKTWGHGLLRFNPARFQFEQFAWQLHPNFPGAENIPSAIAETFDNNGTRTFWIATDFGLFKFPLAAPDFPTLQRPHELVNGHSDVGLPSDGFNSLSADAQGNLWVGTTVNGIYRYNTRQENFQTIKKAKKGGITQVCFTRNGDALVCGVEVPLALYDNRLRLKKSFQRFSKLLDHSEGKVCWEAAKDEESGLLYIATFDGLVAYNEKTGHIRVYRHNPKDSSGLLWRKVTNILPVGQDRLLLGFWKRPLQLFNARTGKSIRVFGHQNIILRRIRQTADGLIWVCTESGLFWFDPVKEQMELAIPPAGIRIWDAHCDASGRTWIGTDNGLWLFDLSSRRTIRKYGIEQGLPGNSIYTVCEDKTGRLWLMTELGLCFFNPATGHSHTIGQMDGLLFEKIEYLMSQAPDGRIWLARGDVIQCFSPERIETPRPSRVYITGLKINEKDTLPDLPFEKIPAIRLQPGQNALTFTYTAIDLETFGKTNFRYRLEGLQTEWVNAGKNRGAAFVNLPAGNYTFRVQPEDAGDSEAFDAVLHVQVTNFFWQRNWFRALVLILLSALTVFGYNRWTNQRLRLRLAELEHAQALENLRLDIAQDIHDEVGADLTKIALAAEFSALLPDLREADFRQKLRQIGAEARQVALHLGEIVFAINPRYDRFAEVQAYFREKGREFLEEAHLSSQFELPPAPGNPPVSPHVKRQLYMLYRESLNNIAKHAGARTVWIGFRFDPEQQEYILEIRDDGKGFDPGSTRQFGNGLKGLRARTDKIGALLDLETAPGEGTTVRVQGRL